MTKSNNRYKRLPSHAFRIGEGDSVGIDQLPELCAMARHVVGKAPESSPVVEDTLGMGSWALGALIGDAELKLMRPRPSDPAPIYPSDDTIFDIVESLLQLPDALAVVAEAVQRAFCCRICEFQQIALNQPERLPSIIANLDALTNARLTERARAILTTGADIGGGDLWAIEELNLPEVHS